MNIYLVIEEAFGQYAEDGSTTTILGGFYNMNNAEILLKEKGTSNGLDGGQIYWIKTVVVTDKPPL